MKLYVPPKDSANEDFDGLANYDFSNDALYTNSVFNADPIFQDVTLNNFNIKRCESGAEGIGKGGVLPILDLNGTIRNATNPDAGAYESIEFPDEG